MSLPSLTIKIVRDADELASLAEAAMSCRVEGDRYDITQDARWLLIAHETSSDSKDRFGVALYDGEELVAFAPMLLGSFSVDCKIGVRSIKSFPMKVASFQGRTFLAKPGTEEPLLRAVEEACSEYPVIKVDSVPTESSFFQALQRPERMGRRWRYEMFLDDEHFLAEIPDTHDEYLAKFKSKTRNTVKRKVKKSQKSCNGELRLVVVREHHQVEKYIADVSSVSRNSWQGQQSGNAINADSTDRIRACVPGGWLRGYVLYAKETPVAFAMGRQSGGVFYYDTVAFDAKRSKNNPGEVLLYLLIVNLCNAPRYTGWIFDMEPLNRGAYSRPAPTRNVTSSGFARGYTLDWPSAAIGVWSREPNRRKNCYVARRSTTRYKPGAGKCEVSSRRGEPSKTESSQASMSLTSHRSRDSSSTT